MTIDLTFTVGNLITLGGLIGFFFWVKFNLDRLIQVVWGSNGNVRLITTEEHDKLQAQCRSSLSKDAGYAREDMLRIEKILEKQNTEITKLIDKMDNLANCVAALKYGADGKDLDNC